MMQVLMGASESHSVLSDSLRPQELFFRLERGPGIALQAMQEKKALSWRGWGRLRGFLLAHPGALGP